MAEGFDKLIKKLSNENIRSIDVDGKSIEEVKEEVLTLVEEKFKNPE